MNAAAEITSFGYGHAAPPEAHLTVDLRRHFRDPHVDPLLRHLTARSPQVRNAVLATPGIKALVAGLADVASAYGTAPRPDPVVIAVGCVGGRHRAPVVAAELAALLEHYGAQVTLTHRDMCQPVIRRELTVPLAQPGGCWCGDLAGHEWPGKASGTPHPRPVAAGAR